MNDDLLIIKKQYGEKMMHLCRDSFSTILDNSPGALSKILLDNFAPNHYLYEDLNSHISYELRNNILEFKNYIYSQYDILKEGPPVNQQKTIDPVNLMHQAGYTLYECHNEEDIQAFKKYYYPGEELCTFNGNRLKKCYVYFAIKDNASKLKRQAFHNPRRQDEYGTSVISIQFTRDRHHTLSIKNRYNHTVPNPDATFSNNLDNIIPGLTESFATHYGMSQRYSPNVFELPGYIRANDGKFYKYNYEIDNVYYCPGNIVIDNFQVTSYPKERYLVFDYFILDLVNKKVINKHDDSFTETLTDIKKISIITNKQGKIITITPTTGENIIIELDKYNRIIGYQNNNSQTISSNFLSYNNTITKLTMNNVKRIGPCFLSLNSSIQEINLPNVEIINDDFLKTAITIKKVSFPKLRIIGDNFMEWACDLEHISLPRVLKIGYSFLRSNNCLEAIILPKVRKINSMFLMDNINLKTVYLPEVLIIEHNFCSTAHHISKLNLSKVKSIGDGFLTRNRDLGELNLPEVETIGHRFLNKNDHNIRVILPKLTSVGLSFMTYCNNVDEFYAPNLKDQEALINRFQQHQSPNNIFTLIKNK